MQRFHLDIGRDDEDRVCGHVARAGGVPVPFSGWLELLRLLEDLADDSINPREVADT
jgi:hypothetical protein